MEDIADVIAGIVVFLLSAMLLSGLFGLFDAHEDYESPNDYAYIDTNGNTGFADYCTTDRGSLRCKKGEKEIIVTEYTKIVEDKKEE